MHGDDVNRQPHYSKTGGHTQGASVAEQLFNLFVGNERRHVTNTGPPFRPLKTGNGKEDPNKWKLNSLTVEGPATVEHWGRHLNGDYILSIIPLLDNGTCWFGCIDYDDYVIDLINICQRIASLKLPLLPCRSKSGGLHIFVFFKEPISAKLIIPALRYWAGRLGLPKFEIFPTNDGTTDSLSRAIAMPYGPTWDVLTPQEALGANGGSALLEQAISSITGMRVTVEDLPKQESSQKTQHQIPLALQTAIDFHWSLSWR